MTSGSHRPPRYGSSLTAQGDGQLAATDSPASSSCRSSLSSDGRDAVIGIRPVVDAEQRPLRAVREWLGRALRLEDGSLAPNVA